MDDLGDYILYPAQAKCILRVSLISILSCSYAIYRGHYDLAIVPGGVFLTSLNYWRQPTYGWRRNLDIAYVCGALIYQNKRAYDMPNAVPYYYLMGFGSLLYPMNIYLYKKKYYWGSTIAHCMLHIMANISNVVLYSGNCRGDMGSAVRSTVGSCHPPSWSAAAFRPFGYPCFFRGHIVCPI